MFLSQIKFARAMRMRIGSYRDHIINTYAFSAVQSTMYVRRTLDTCRVRVIYCIQIVEATEVTTNVESASHFHSVRVHRGRALSIP